MHDRRMIPADRPLRVLQVDPNANTPPYDRALCSALARAGCSVTLLTSRFLYEPLPRPTDFRLDERFFRVVGSGRARRFGVDNRPALRRALKAAEYPLDWALLLAKIAARRPDVVHVQWTLNPALDLAVWRALRRLAVPLVYTVHNLVPHDARADDSARYGRLYHAADALIVHSERSLTALQSDWSVPAERIAVVPMGPMLEAWPPVERATARQRLGLPPDAEVILFAGLIEPYKALDDLVAAFGLLAERRPVARLVVAGKPNQPFDSYRRQLERLGLLERTMLDLRFLPEPRLTEYLCAADVVVLPYRSVTSSAMLLAARRFGCAIVATDAGDLGEVITDGESGLLVPTAAPPALADAVERLLADPALAARLGTSGQRATLGPQGYAEIARRTIAVYQRVRSFRRGALIR